MRRKGKKEGNRGKGGAGCGKEWVCEQVMRWEGIYGEEVSKLWGKILWVRKIWGDMGRRNGDIKIGRRNGRKKW